MKDSEMNEEGCLLSAPPRKPHFINHFNPNLQFETVSDQDDYLPDYCMSDAEVINDVMYYERRAFHYA